jgi:hypothetical protein
MKITSRQAKSKSTRAALPQANGGQKDKLIKHTPKYHYVLKLLCTTQEILQGGHS